MADYCKQCSIDEFGKDFRELAELSTRQDTGSGLFASVICEGCGFVQVDHEGRCVSRCEEHAEGDAHPDGSRYPGVKP